MSTPSLLTKSYTSEASLCKTIKPNDNPAKVPIALPKVPTNNAGNKRLCQPLADASAEAVAAFPIFALDAMSKSGRGIRDTLPMPRTIAKWVRYRVSPYPNNPAVPFPLMVLMMVPLELPMLPKNKSNNSFPSKSPEGTKEASLVGKAVA